MITVELIYDKDCPNIKKARAQLIQSFYAANVQSNWKEWDRSATDTPAYALAYGSPTILVNGEDVAGTSPSEGINCCRLYLDKNGQFQGVPSVEEVSSALLRAGNISVAGSSSGRQSNWHRILATLPGIFIALLPKLTCPACWPLYAGLLSSIGLGFVNYTPYLFPLTVLFLILAVATLGYRAKNRRGYKPLALGTVGAIIVIVGKFVAGSNLAMYGGIALLMGASLWNVWPNKATGNVSCPSCVTKRLLSNNTRNKI